MPFDGVGFGFDDRMSKIDKVINLLATPDRWCKGTLRTHDGRHCIRGAIMAVDGVGTLQPMVLRAINEVTGRHYRRIESFNDHPDTDHARVVEVLARPVSAPLRRSLAGPLQRATESAARVNASAAPRVLSFG